MSTFLRSTIQSSLRRNLCRPAFHQNIRQFHYTSPKMTVHNLQTYVLAAAATRPPRRRPRGRGALVVP